MDQWLLVIRIPPTKIFADFDKFFAETREDLVDGILGHILEDTITVLQESESGGKE